MRGDQSRSKGEVVVCRVIGCVNKEGNQKGMKRSSYKEHLTLKHPKETPNDPRGYCTKKQTTLNFFTVGSKVSSKDREKHTVVRDERQERVRERSRSPLKKDDLELEESYEQDDVDGKSSSEEEVDEDDVDGKSSSEEEVDKDALQEVVLKVKNIKDASVEDLKEVVKGGMVENLVSAIEQAADGEMKMDLMSKDDKVTLMSNIQKIIEMDNIAEDLEERTVEVGLQVLKGLQEEVWTDVSAREAKMFNKLMTQCSMPGWARAVLGGLLTRVEDNGRNEDAVQDNVLKDVNDNLAEVVKKIVVNPPDLSSKTFLEAIKVNSEIIAGQVKVGNIVRDLETAVKELKNVSCVEVGAEKENSEETSKAALKSCRDVDQISAKFAEFPCQGGVNQCKVCTETKFAYTRELQTRDKEDKIPPKLASLKQHLQEHMASAKHQRRLKDVKNQEKDENKWLNRNKEIGKKLFKVIYLINNRGLPFTLYPEVVMLLSDFKVDVGDLNHSKELCRNALPAIAKVNFISS